MKIILALLLLPAAVSWAQSPPVPFELTIRSTIPVDSSKGTALADMNGDGRPDLITKTIAGFAIRLNDGTGAFPASAPVYPYPLGITADNFGLFVVADFTHDKLPDLALLTSGGIYLYPGDGKGGLLAPQFLALPLPQFPMNAVVADFNGDGLPDIAIGVAYAAGYLRVFLGTDAGSFQEVKNPFNGTVPAPSAPILQVADVNHDGKPDLILRDVLPRTIIVCLNDGTGKFTVSQVIQRGELDRPQSFAFGYFDKDGAPGLVIDYLSLFRFQDNLELWKADATGQFTLRSVFKLTAELQTTVVSADVDGDGNLDVIGSTPTGTTVFFGDGSGSFPRTATVPDALGALFPADLDGDGKPEIVVTNAQSVSVLGSTVRAARISLTRDPPNPFTYGQVEFLTVSAVASFFNPAAFNSPLTGTISLYNGTQLLAVSPLVNGSARFSTRYVPGIHAFHAVYSGDTTNGPASADLAVTEAGAPTAITALFPVFVDPKTGNSPFQVLVTDALGIPVSNAGVIFTAPIYGPSGTFNNTNTALTITGPDGIATAPQFIRNNYPGSYSITATVSGYPSVTTAIPVTN